MNKKSGTSKDATVKLVGVIKRKTCKQYSAEEKIRVVLTTPDVVLDLKRICLEMTVQRLSISREDRIDNRIVGIDRHVRFVQPTGAIANKTARTA